MANQILLNIVYFSGVQMNWNSRNTHWDTMENILETQPGFFSKLKKKTNSDNIWSSKLYIIITVKYFFFLKYNAS